MLCKEGSPLGARLERLAKQLTLNLYYVAMVSQGWGNLTKYYCMYWLVSKKMVLISSNMVTLVSCTTALVEPHEILLVGVEISVLSTPSMQYRL